MPIVLLAMTRKQMQEIFSRVFPPEQTESLMDVFDRVDRKVRGPTETEQRD